MTIGSNADDYLQQLINLTPPGNAFPTLSTSNWVQLLSAFAETLSRADINAVLLSDEAFPDRTSLLLSDWERVAGLPDECSELGETYIIRRKNLLQKLTSRGSQTKQYFIDLALSLGFTITVTEFKPFRVGYSSMGDPLCDEDWWFAWQVNAPEETITWFRAGESGAHEPLASWGNDRLECVLTKNKPAHTTVLFAYG